MLLLVLLAAVDGLLTPYDPIAVNLVVRLQPPNLAHPFGTDEFGRDVLSRVVQGTRISLLVASISVVVATVLGVSLGLVPGYLRGWTDFAIQRVNEVLLAFPGLLLALAIVGGLGPGLNNVMIAVGLASSPFFIRVVRGAVLSIRERDFILAARLIGRQRPAHHASPYRSECHLAGSGRGFPAGGLVDFGHRGAEFPGARRPAAHTGMGHDAQLRSGLYA